MGEQTFFEIGYTQGEKDKTIRIKGTDIVTKDDTNPYPPFLYMG